MHIHTHTHTHAHTHTQKQRRHPNVSVSNTSLSFSPSSTPTHPSLLSAASRPSCHPFLAPSLTDFFPLYPFHLYFGRSPALRFVSLFESCEDSTLPPRGDVVGTSTLSEMLTLSPIRQYTHAYERTHTAVGRVTAVTGTKSQKDSFYLMASL